VNTGHAGQTGAAEAWPSPARAWTTVAILNLAYLVSFVDRTILSLLIEPIKADLAISDTQVSLLQGAAFAAFYVVLGVPFGWAVDRFSRTRIIGVACALWCAMTAACGLASTFGQLFLARLGVGVGEAALSPGAASLIADLFPPQRRALAMSVYAMGASLGIGLSLVAGALVVQAVGSAGWIILPIIGTVATWQATLIIVGLAGLVVAIAILLLPEAPRRDPERDSGGERGGLAAFLRMNRRRLTLHFGAITLYGLVTYAVLSWVPTLFIRIHGWTAAETGFRYGLMFMVCGGAGAVSGGWLSAKLAALEQSEYDLKVAFIGIVGFIPFGIAANLVNNPWLALALFGPVSFCFALPTGSSIAALQRVTPSRLRGQVASIYYLVVGLFGLIFGPLAVAVVTDFVIGNPMAIGASLALVIAAFGTLGAAMLVPIIRLNPKLR
jgi:MFS family permease